MNNRIVLAIVFVLAFTGLLVLSPMTTGAQVNDEATSVDVLAEVGTAFTYQGKLTDGGVPADGLYDFKFDLYDAVEGIDPPLATLILEDEVVDQGLFTVKLDFGEGVFDGNARWMAIGVRPWDETGEFTTLEGRQEIAPTPYAIYAQTAPWDGLANLPGGFADGVDNDTTYSPGYGLNLSAGEFSVELSQVQHRVYGSCAVGQSIRTIYADGTVACEVDNDTTYTPGYGLNLSAGQFSVDTGEIQDRVHGSCPTGQSIRVVNQDGTVACEVDNDSGGDITAVYAGLGLSGGGTAGAVTLNASFAGSGSATTISRSDHDHMGQTWTGYYEPLHIQGTYQGTADQHAPLILSNSYGGGLVVYQAYDMGVLVEEAGGFGVLVRDARDGLQINNTVEEGVSVVNAGTTGYTLYSAVNDGIRINNAGSPAESIDSSYSNGVEVQGAQGYGMWVGYAGYDGIGIRKSADDGIQIGDGTNFPSYGLYIPNSGVPNYALWVNTSNAYGNYALYTPDNILAGNVTSSAYLLLAQVDGSGSLAAGDLASAIGVAESIEGFHARIPTVRAADSTYNGVIGVVHSRIALNPAPGKEEEGAMVLESVPGLAKAGDYVALVVMGVADVRVDPAVLEIEPGQRLTASALAGAARPLRTETLNGMVVTEGAPVIGIALAAPEPGSETIPVLVTLR